VVAETHDARERMNRALYHNLHRHRYRPPLGEGIRSRIPADLEDRTAGVVLEACRQFGFETVAKPGEDTWYIEFGHEAVIHSLPDVPEGSRWLGTFSREEAVEHETLDFFASGHPLVEGILLELEDGHRGQVTAMEIEGTGIEGEGLAVVVKRGSEFEAIVVDLGGRRHPEWSRFIVEEPGSRRPASSTEWGMDVDAWAARVRELLYPLQSEGKLVAAAVFRFV
jgi:ATP-dependent helicase HepA